MSGARGVGVDPSKLHLRKELSQIRKAARVLRDPGTTSSWSKSPLDASSRSVSSPIVAAPAPACNRVCSNDNGARQKKVFLHNWRSSCISSSEKSIARGRASHGDDGSYLAPGSLEEDSLRDSKGGDSDVGNEAHHPHSQSPLLIPSRRSTAAGTNKRKSKKLQKHHRKSVQSMSQISRNAHAHAHAPSICLAEQSDDTESYCNSEYFRRVSVASPLLSRLRYNNSPHSASKLLIRNTRKDDSSYTYNSTPALSTRSYRYNNSNNGDSLNPNSSTVESWDCTMASYNEGDSWADDDGLDFPGRQGCGIPCYWSRRTTPKHRMYGSSCCSPSLSDTLRRMYRTRRHQSSSDVPNKLKIASRTVQGVLPLLTNGSDDDLSTNFGELELEALSRLDGRRWSSSCRSEEALELQALTTGEGVLDGTPENIRSLSQKYRPVFFAELVGQNIVVQSLNNAASRRRAGPVYLFHGPRGTGKTSAAMIFAAALNCLGTEETKPCGVCRECTDCLSSKSGNPVKIDGTSKKAVDKIRYLLKNLLVSSQTAASSRYKVVVVDECHLLPSKMWVPFLKSLEEPLPRVVFILVTTDLDSMPRTVLSRCQKYLFNKIKDCDIVARLRKISDEENLNIELDALNLIALNADGSLRDAETMLDQLSLLGKRITTSLVNELLGVVSDDTLLELLELAMSPDTAETVKRARELLDSGIDPTVLMSQMASLIMDLIAGTYGVTDTNTSIIFGGRSLTEVELERLKHALKLLSNAEKQLRVSNERSTWFTATLLQLGSVSSSDFTRSGGSWRQSSKTTEEEDPSRTSKEIPAQKHNLDGQCAPQNSTSSSVSIPHAHPGGLLPLDDLNSETPPIQLIDGSSSAVSRDDFMVGNVIFSCTNSGKLEDIWTRCIERCHSKTLRQLLHAHGKLFSISKVEGALIAYIAFKYRDIKSRVERFMSSVTDSMETILRCHVVVRIILFPDADTPSKPVEVSGSLNQKQHAKDSHQEAIKFSKGNHANSENNSPSMVAGNFQRADGSPLLAGGNTEISSMEDSIQEISMQRIESIIYDQKLETAWLQTIEKGTPGSISRLKLEKNQVVPQDGIHRQLQMESMGSKDLSSSHWEDELKHGIIVSNMNDERAVQKNQISKRVDCHPLSPSLLHDSSFVGDFDKDNHGYESGAGDGGCSALFCWNNTKNHHRGKVKRVPSVRRRFLPFGECGLSKKR